MVGSKGRLHPEKGDLQFKNANYPMNYKILDNKAILSLILVQPRKTGKRPDVTIVFSCYL